MAIVGVSAQPGAKVQADLRVHQGLLRSRDPVGGEGRIDGDGPFDEAEGDWPQLVVAGRRSGLVLSMSLGP